MRNEWRGRGEGEEGKGYKVGQIDKVPSPSGHQVAPVNWRFVGEQVQCIIIYSSLEYSLPHELSESS